MQTCEWQPIETAPTTKWVLIATRSFEGGVVQATWSGFFGHFVDFDGDPYEDATHWMPLPLPPQGAGDPQ